MYYRRDHTFDVKTCFQQNGYVFDVTQWLTEIFNKPHSLTILVEFGVENRNILLWFKCVFTALHVNCMILFDKVL